MRNQPPPTEKELESSDLIIWYEHLIISELEGDHGEQWLMVNPDYYDGIDDKHCGRLTGMIHKSEVSYGLFSKKYPDLEHINMGWTSEDLYKDYVPKDYNKVFAQLGCAWRRQQRLIYELLATNKDFPQTLITQYDKSGTIRLPFPMTFKHDDSEIEHNFIIDHMDRSFMINALNERGIHLCLGEAEGFGHYINEGRSSKAVCVAMDAPPMNELITKDNGILIKPTHYENPADRKQDGVVPLSIAGRDVFYDGFEKLEAMSIKDREELGEQARKDFLTGKKKFEENINKFFEEKLK